MAEAIGGKPTTFLTLTCRRGEAKTVHEAAKLLSKAWRLLRLRIIRHRKWATLPFIAVFEAHKTGWPHLHIMLRCGFIDQHWISAQMRELLNSPVCDIRKIDRHRKVAAYVAKYVTKATHRFKHSKRYWQSQDYDQRPTPPERQKLPPGQGWDRQDFSLDGFCTAFAELGYSVERLSQHRALARPPP